MRNAQCSSLQRTAAEICCIPLLFMHMAREKAMFSEYLKTFPLEEKIHLPYHPFPVPEGFLALPESEKQAIRRMHACYREQPYPMRTCTDFLAFVRTGSRKKDEDPYFLRRNKLCAATLAALIGEDCLDEVIDGIWCICEETTWVISAHNVNPIPGAPKASEYPLPDVNLPYIDLFSAQTGMILALVQELLGPRLMAVSPVIPARIRQEIWRRILAPFMEHDEFWWMGIRRKDLCNWTPWILSNIMMAAALQMEEREKLSGLMVRSCEMLDRYLEVVPEDGGCDEGAGYWNMAGGALLDCLQFFEEITEGAMQLWDQEKIRNIMEFPAKAYLGNGWFMNFADCDARPKLSGERLQFAGEKLGIPALIALGSEMRDGMDFEDVPHFSRALRDLFHPKQRMEQAFVPEGNVWLPNLGVAIYREGPFALCVKGGHNGENHNHNDVGSFILYCDGQPEIVDAGNMTYTAKTFSEERYTLFNTRSAYHNVPMIGDSEQLPGAEHGCEMQVGDRVTISYAGAYGLSGLHACIRKIFPSERAIRMSDTVECELACPVTFVFMLRNKPEIRGSQVFCGSIRMEFLGYNDIEAEEIPVTDPRMAKSFEGSLWRLLVRTGARKTHTLLTTITRKTKREETMYV